MKPNPTHNLAALLVLALTAALIGCANPQEQPTVMHPTVHVGKDSAWAAFDSISIAWYDPVTGAGATLFQGKPSDLSKDNAFASEGYRGQAVEIRVKGYAKGALAFEEKRVLAADGATLLSKEIILAYIPKPDTLVIPIKPDTIPTLPDFLPVFPVHPL